jgi:hypothetical protein
VAPILLLAWPMRRRQGPRIRMSMLSGSKPGATRAETVGATTSTWANPFHDNSRAYGSLIGTPFVDASVLGC